MKLREKALTNVDIIERYIKDFYTLDEKALITSTTNIGFSVEKFKKEFNSNEWLNIENKYKDLLPYSSLDDFHLEVADRASFFIKKIFSKYVTDDTFVIHSSFEHPNVEKELAKVKHKKQLLYNQIISFNFEGFLTEYKISGCNKIFVYVPGTSTCTGQIIPQYFYTSIKAACEKYNIPCMMVCDDVHGMFITPRDYSIFDFVLYTCHSFISNFDMGMLWSKYNEKLGYTNIERANAYYNNLILFLSKSDEIRIFPLLLAEYFAEELADPKYIELYTNTSCHIFALKTKGLIFNQKYFDLCDKYNVRLGETRSFINFMRFRIQEFILEDPSILLNGLAMTKEAISKFKAKAEFLPSNTVFDGQRNISHEIKENILLTSE